MKKACQTLITITLNPALDKTWQAPGLQLDDPIRLQSLAVTAGGKGINAARVFRKLGGSTAALYLFGGAAGQRLNELVKGEGLTQAAFQVSGETRENWTIHLDDTDQYLKLNTPGPVLTANEAVALLQFCGTVLSKNTGAAVLLTGSAAAGIDRAFMTELCGLIKNHASKCYLDADKPLFDLLPQTVQWDAMKPNHAEAARITGLDISQPGFPAKAIEVLLNTARFVLLTEGPKGVSYLTKDGRLRTEAPAQILPNAPAGMGDAFFARYIFAELTGMSKLEDRVRFAQDIQSETL